PLRWTGMQPPGRRTGSAVGLCPTSAPLQSKKRANEMSSNGRAEEKPLSADCPLAARDQVRNLLLFGFNKCLIYLSAPVLCVALVQAALFQRLQATQEVPNLPGSLYFAMTPLPIIVAWYFCSIRHIKPVLVTAYLVTACSGAVVMATLLTATPAWLVPSLEALDLPPNWVILAVIAHALIVGGAAYTVEAYQWEVLARGVSEVRRGVAFSFAYG